MMIRTVYFQGQPVTVTGAFPVKGQKGKPFSLVSSTLEDISLSRFVGQRKVLSIFPSVDIRGYYRNIDKQTLLSQVRQHVAARPWASTSGRRWDAGKGISRGCSLSPLMGALHLYDMDEHFAKQANIHYARYMDDIIILAKSRWSLRRHTKRLMQWFSEYGFEAHPDKTFIGRTEKGFDWMGAWLTHEGVRDIAPRAKANHREKVRRLYERLTRVPLWRRKRARQEVHAKVSTYRKRWNILALYLAACTPAASQADDIVVIASGNHSGDTGARTRLAGTSSVGGWRGKYKTGLCFMAAGTPGKCNGTLWYHDGSVSPTDFRVSDTNNPAHSLIVVPTGYYSIELNKATEVRSMLFPSGKIIYGNGSTDLGCAATPGLGGRPFPSATYYGAGCSPANISINPQTDNAKRTWDLTLAYYATGPLTAGKLTWPVLSIGYDNQSAFTSLTLPTSVVILGLNCNISTTQPSTDLGTVTNQDPAGISKAVANFTITTECGASGTASSDPSTELGLEFEPAAGYVATDYKLTQQTQPGFYGTVNPSSSASCSSGLTLDGTGFDSVKVVAPGTNPGAVSKSYVFSLCSTGAAQTPGDYSLKLVTKLVSR